MEKNSRLNEEHRALCWFHSWIVPIWVLAFSVTASIHHHYPQWWLYSGTLGSITIVLGFLAITIPIFRQCLRLYYFYKFAKKQVFSNMSSLRDGCLLLLPLITILLVVLWHTFSSSKGI